MSWVYSESSNYTNLKAHAIYLQYEHIHSHYRQIDYNIHMLYALIACDLLMALVFILKMSQLPPQIPLYYSRTFGEEQLGEVWHIFLLPVIMHLILFLNLYFYNHFFIPDQFIKKIFTIVNWFTIISLTLIFIKIIFYIA